MYIKVLEYLKNGGESNIFNFGSSNGFLVKEMFEVVCIVIGKEILVEVVLCCVGDLGMLIVLSDKVCEIFGWELIYIDVKDIIVIVWKWYVFYLNGY